MKNKNFVKYKDLDERYFSTNCAFTYMFTYDNQEYAIDWDWDNKSGYFFYKKNTQLTKVPYKTIYEALDKIKFNGKSLRWLLLNTDFDFDAIS